jgi:hypothetical protein
MNEIGIIVTLKKTLELYANSKNYETVPGALSIIDMDKGEMARSVLEMIDTVEKANDAFDTSTIDRDRTDFDTLENFIQDSTIYD